MNELKPCPFEAKAEAIAAWTRRRAQPEPAALPPKERLALNVRHPDCHKAADAFWSYWNENGETHKRGYYESTWGAINRALRTVGVVEHGPSPAATVKDSLTPDAAPSVAPNAMQLEPVPDPMNYKGMFLDAVQALADIDRLLGLPEDGCNDPQITVSALADYIAGAKETAAYRDQWVDAQYHAAAELAAAPSVAPEPVAWTLQSELDAAQTTCSAHLWFTNPRNSAWTALFTREQIAAHPPRAPLTEEQRRDLVKECGLDWQRGYMPLFEGDPTNRYAVLVEAVEAAHGIGGK